MAERILCVRSMYSENKDDKRIKPQKKSFENLQKDLFFSIYILKYFTGKQTRFRII